MSPFEWFSVGSSVLGMLSGNSASKAAQKAEKRRAQAIAQANEFAAQQDDQNALLAPAVAQRKAITADRNADQMIRDLMAHFSKGGPISAGQMSLLAEMEAQKAYNASSIRWEGNNDARKYRMDAAGRRYQGAAGIADAKANEASYSTARGASIFKDVSTLFSRYGGELFNSGDKGRSTYGDTTYYGGAGPDASWGYGD